MFSLLLSQYKEWNDWIFQFLKKLINHRQLGPWENFQIFSFPEREVRISWYLKTNSTSPILAKWDSNSVVEDKSVDIQTLHLR